MMSNSVGARKTLPKSSMATFNLWDTTHFAAKIHGASQMGEEEKNKNHEGLMAVVDNWTR